ncbi:MAG TPA: O-antigen ligase family protein [Terriglobales bacterium]|nr:O-antigen ligase family protein [Terriglobales bacterium]
MRDCKRRTSVSAAVWIPTILLLILGSRPVSLWLAGGAGSIGEMGNEIAGNLIDQLFFAFILGGALLVASSRRVKWGKFFAANPAIMVFYGYFLLSVCWSGDPGGSIKRVVKDFGMLFVIAVIFSEKNPLQAMRAVYVRCAFVLFPLSAVFVKYFPEYSRSFTIAGDVMITGVTTQKNSLGEIVLVFTLFLVWDYLETPHAGKKFRWSRIPWDNVIVLLMGAWLLHLSESKTSLMCLLVGAFLIVRSGWLVSKTVNRVALAGALSLPFLLFFSQQFSSVIAPIVEAMGRNMTFTGRTDIWAHITSKTVNPLIGAGYWNFWGGPSGFAISQAMTTIVPNAHCGYVDMYLDGGIICLCILFFMLLICGRRIIKYLTVKNDADRYKRVRFAFLVVAIIYNLSETAFARISPIWFTTLLMLVTFPAMKTAAKKTRETLRTVAGPPSIGPAHL